MLLIFLWFEWNCGMKLLERIFSRNGFTPVFCMYLVRFRLKSLVLIKGLFSNVSFSSRVLRKLLLNACFKKGCSQTALIKRLFLLGISTSVNTDSSSLGQYIGKSFWGLHERFWEIQIKVPPAEDSVGVCSILKPGRSKVVVL